MSGTATWHVEHLTAAASVAHAHDLTARPLGRFVRVHHVTRPALVLGSAQREDVVDGAAVARAGIEVVRRRSGGGAVLLVPGETVWADVVIPVEDRLWQDDVGRAMHWVGDAWAEALRRMTGLAVDVHRGPLIRSPWSALICFAGLGAGEVTLDGRKVVGISQRRTRVAARFQTAALLRWDAAAIVALLALDPAERARARVELEAAAAGVSCDGERLAAAFVDALPD